MDSGDYTARAILRGAAQQQQQQTIDPDAMEAKATRVSVSGVSRIRPGVLNALVHRIMLARTVSDVAMEAREAAGRLQALGMAKAAYVVLDHTGGANGARHIDVALECVDGPRYSVRTEAGVDDAEGTAGVAARLINIFGGGEAADFHYTRGSRTRAAFQTAISLPVAADPLRSVSFAAAQRSITCAPYSAHDELLRELLVRYTATGTHNTANDLGYVLAWRNVCSLGATASPTLRSEAGHSLKSALCHTLAWDTRDSSRMPTRGSLLKLTTECAGLIDALGDARFVKTRAEFQTNQHLGSRYVVSAGVQAGLLWNIDPKARSFLADRFFLGGSTSVRGFEHHGIGPRDGNDCIGGDVFYAAGVSLLTPLPLIATDAIRGHVWANAGQLALLDSRGLKRSHANVHRFLMSPSAAVGVGLVYNHSMVRAELSLCFPIAATPTDRPRPGLQFGLGITFL
ncbi:hypothetical protein GGI23_001245 [Coemansia sp. RSA 2559]|nr:hypothetical protein GGI23_001245 [Coemansia sp. RSA 2559]